MFLDIKQLFLLFLLSILVSTLINSCCNATLTVLKSILSPIILLMEKFYCCRSEVMDTAILLCVSFANRQKLSKICEEYLNRIYFVFFSVGLNTKSVMHCEKYEKDGETFLRMKNYDVKFTPTKVFLQFDNLFDGDALLSKHNNE